MTAFPSRLQKTRLERGLSRKEVADFLEITSRAYQYYEEGKREPNYDRLVQIAKYLNVSTDYLLGLKD